MKEEEQLILDIIKKRKEREKIVEEETALREQLLTLMQSKDLTKINTGKYVAVIEQKHKINEDALRNKYPEIFMSGMEYKFKEHKAKRFYPRNVVINAIENTSEGMTEYVKIRHKNKRRKI